MLMNVGEILADVVNSMKAGKVYHVEKNTYIDKMVAHIKRLDADDRRMRFGVSLGDERIEHYVNDAIKENDYVFAVFDDSGNIVGLLHMARERKDGQAYELGLSVDKEYRKHGYASALFAKAISFAKTMGAKRIYTYCLGENRAMQSLAKKNDLRVMLEHGDYTGELQLGDRSTPEIVKDLVDFASTEQMMIFDRMSERYVNTLLMQYAAFEKSAEAYRSIFIPSK